MEASKMNLKGLLRNVNLLNILLIAGGLVFTYFTLVPLTETDSRYLPAAVKSKGEEKKAEEATPPPALSPNDYAVIGDLNLFHPDRKIPPEKKELPPLPMPEFVLFGTLVTSDLSLAYLEDKKAPVSTPGRGPRQSALKKGETLSGFTLKEIMADKVVMTRGDDILTVLLTDPKAPKSREGAGSAGTAKPPIAGAPAPAVRPASPSAATAPRPGVAQPFSPGRPQVAQPPQPSAPPSMTSGPPVPGGVSPKDVIAPQRPRYRTVPAAPAGPYP
jgi:hypothetical protein